jgi:preprotein translocase subunit SecA
VKLTGEGKRKLADLCGELGGIWAGARRREEMVIQALVAREVYVLEKQYVIQDDKVVIVDEFTGRLMPDREWRDGLHQAVSAKEGVEIQPPKETLARISFQNFYRMYRRLSGMTATAWEARAELWQIYRLPVVPLPTHRPCRRKMIPDRVYTNQEAKWRAIAGHIAQVHATGQPILVGTRSVQASELLSRMLASCPPPLMKGQGEGESASNPNGDTGKFDGEVTLSPALPLKGEGAKPTAIPHQVLNAVRHKEEAAIVAGAGGNGKVTVATNMAGRGTDIKLAPGIEDLGGLYVIATERHESGRVDRQLFGRCARQGDRGVATAIVCADDELLVRHGSRLGRILLKLLANGEGEVPRRLASRLIRMAQRHAERQALRQRKTVMRTDSWLDQALGFAGQE